jgi:hypothetical protein
MSDPLDQAQARRRELLHRYLSLYPDGAPLPGSDEERADLHAALNVLRQKIVRLIVRRWLEMRGPHGR